MLYLDAQEIMESAGLNEIMDTIEEAYSIEAKGQYEMPSRMHLNFKDNTLLYMPCFINSVFGTKILTLFPGNISKNMPVIDGVVLLNDIETGAPLAILDGARITSVRTGAVGGVAVRHRAPAGAKSVGLIGAGVQGFFLALFACKARPVKEVRVYDICPDKVKAFCDQLKKELPDLSIKPVQSVEELLLQSEIVITATPSQEPVLPDKKDLLEGKCYIGIGSYKPEMREFPKALYALIDKIVIDTEHGLHESGDLITPLEKKWINKNQIIKFGRYLESKKEKADDKERTTLFKSVGMALFDIVVAERIYSNALQKGLGKIL